MHRRQTGPARGRHASQSAISTRRDMKYADAIHAALPRLFHLKGKHLLAKQLIEGLEKEVF